MATPTSISQNFAFLRHHSRELVKLGTLAERYFADDPNTCLIKLRQFGEVLAQLLAAKIGLYEEPGESQARLLQRLKFRGAIAGQIADMFHDIRTIGNDATHNGYGHSGQALTCLKYARTLGIWYHRTYGGARTFQAGAFVPPSNPVQEAEGVNQELEILRAELAASQAAQNALADQAAIAQAQAEEEAALRQLAEQFMQEAESRAEDAQAQIAEISDQFQVQLQAMQAVAVQAPAQSIQQLVTAGQPDEDNLDLDERATRKLIDLKLREAGWEVDSEMLTYGKALRPQKGKCFAEARPEPPGNEFPG